MRKPIFEDSFTPVDERDIQRFEPSTGRQLPPAFRTLLLQQNGGHPVPSDVRFFNAIALLS